MDEESFYRMATNTEMEKGVEAYGYPFYSWMPHSFLTQESLTPFYMHAMPLMDTPAIETSSTASSPCSIASDLDAYSREDYFYSPTSTMHQDMFEVYQAQATSLSDPPTQAPLLLLTSSLPTDTIQTQSYPTPSPSCSTTSSKSREYRCTHPQCGRTFGRPNNYKAHLKTHVATRPFICTMCDRCFTRKHDLERHFRVHTGDKPYSCPCCHKGFARTDALKRHLRLEDACRMSPQVQLLKNLRRYKDL
ncbi:hypothetical protein BZG36_03858 [Bifiguratus adelaidae]|uniref:C2H2-type domain-containing protein n=1 Tax=Bifiguratus adelaidae TaxID=1938954 RepID=A0A261XWH5_9FUNG|nr:hypothetical protein BZG36_03858 [Bifiguratus adelaidae]